MGFNSIRRHRKSLALVSTPCCYSAKCRGLFPRGQSGPDVNLITQLQLLSKDCSILKLIVGCPANLGCLTVDGLTTEQSVVISLSNDRNTSLRASQPSCWKNFNVICLYSNSAICSVSKQVRCEAQPLALRSPNLMPSDLSLWDHDKHNMYVAKWN